MLERDADGFIIGKLPESAKPYKNLSYLVVPEVGGLSEYTPDAYNSVNTFFRNLLQSPFEIDNLNHCEWNEITTGLDRTELANICEVAYEKTAALFVAELANTLSETLKSSEPEEYKNFLLHETVLDICIAAVSGKVHIEIPYCTVKNICESGVSF